MKQMTSSVPCQCVLFAAVILCIPLTFFYDTTDILNIWAVSVGSSHGYGSDESSLNQHTLVPDMKGQCAVDLDAQPFNDIPSSLKRETAGYLGTAEFVCPAISKTYPKFQCKRNSTFTDPSLPMVGFMRLILDNNMTLLYVGDSLQEQMYHEFLCAVEAEDSSLLEVARRHVMFASSYFLATLPQECVVMRPQFNVTMLQNEDWVQKAIDKNITHLVFNTGAWFIPSGIYVKRRKATRSQTRKCFHKQFSSPSRLYQHLQFLSQQHGVQLIWRDITPAGVCDGEGSVLESKYTSYYNDFSHYNRIAQYATVHQLKGSVIPGIWEASLSQWREHISVEDTLHWCAFRTHSVPREWNSKLFQLLQTKLLS
jgi:hypothetical protein